MLSRDDGLANGGLQEPTTSLDPADWPAARRQAHAMLDWLLDDLQQAASGDGPVWRPMPPDVRAAFDAALPVEPAPIETVADDVRALVAPYATGNRHPRFFGWVHGAGSFAGMLGEMLAAGLNMNCGGRDHAGIEVERQIARWMADFFGFPADASGLFVTGTSMANFLAVLAARRAALGPAVRTDGVGDGGGLVAYASAAAHGCIARAMDMAGLGTDALRLLPVRLDGSVVAGAVAEAVAHDRAAGRRPFLVVGTAGTVDTGGIDDLSALADIAAGADAWFHVDGAFGALAVLSPSLAPLLAGIERADSVGFDFHKWGQVPYDAGFLLTRSAAAQRAAFESDNAYLRRNARGLAGGSPWPCDYGPDLSRGARALKTWVTLRTYGLDGIGAAIEQTCRLARVLQSHIEANDALELLAPVTLNIVCFRPRPRAEEDIDALVDAVVVALHESGVAVPSVTRLPAGLAIRCAIVNHRTTEADLRLLIAAVLAETSRLRSI